eukprot:3467250-Prymnesium_polylepis.1
MDVVAHAVERETARVGAAGFERSTLVRSHESKDNRDANWEAGDHPTATIVRKRGQDKVCLPASSCALAGRVASL